MVHKRANWFQFRLSWLLLLMTFLSMLCWVYTNRTYFVEETIVTLQPRASGYAAMDVVEQKTRRFKCLDLFDDALKIGIALLGLATLSIWLNLQLNKRSRAN